MIHGRIRVNHHVVRSLSYLIDIDNDIVELDKKVIVPEFEKYYLILNKPKGYITSMSDEKGRPIVMDLLPQKYRDAGIFPVGRLDKNTEGLLFLTNDGDLAYKLTHPKFSVSKEYIVELDKPLKASDKKKIEFGVRLYGKKTNPAKIDFQDSSKREFNITITEGRKRQIRIIFRNLSYRVVNLKRISYGPFRLGKMDIGSFRQLRIRDIRQWKDHL